MPEQPSPDGLAQAFIIGEKFIGNDCTSLVLGDNIFYGAGLNDMLKQAVTDAEQNGKATVFGYRVSDPERYGVAEFDKDGNCLSIEEKPEHPKSNLCRSRAVFLSEQGGKYSQEHQAFCAWRAGDYDCEPRVSERQGAESADHEPAALHGLTLVRMTRCQRHRHSSRFGRNVRD